MTTPTASSPAEPTPASGAAFDTPADLSHIAPRDKAEILSQALPYIRKFHGKTIIIKYGGNAMTEPALQQDFAEDVVLLKLVGLNPVVVHGGGPQIDTALSKLGKKGTFIQGMRVTDKETMDVVEWVLGGEVQQDIVGLINNAGGKAVGLTGFDGGMIRARKLKMKDKDDPNIEHDVGQVGDIVSIDPSVVKALQDDQFIPVVSPIGFGEGNVSYNINADVVARHGYHPQSISFWRFVLGAASLLLVFGRGMPWARLLREGAPLLGAGAVMASYVLLWFIGIAHIGAAIPTLIALCLPPVFVTAWALARGRQRASVGLVAILAASLAGTVLLIVGGGSEGGARPGATTDDWIRGVAASVGSALLYAGFTLASPGISRQWGAGTAT